MRDQIILIGIVALLAFGFWYFLSPDEKPGYIGPSLDIEVLEQDRLDSLARLQEQAAYMAGMAEIKRRQEEFNRSLDLLRDMRKSEVNVRQYQSIGADSLVEVHKALNARFKREYANHLKRKDSSWTDSFRVRLYRDGVLDTIIFDSVPL